jgi:hypothetical protein
MPELNFLCRKSIRPTKNRLKPPAWLLLLVCIIGSGCTSIPLPKYAKMGDFVTVPIGGTKTVANSNYLKASDLDVTVIDSAGQQFPANVLRLYRVFADPSSRYALASLDADSSINGIVYANEGQWMMQFVMPSGNDLAQTPVPGIAEIAVVSTEINPDPDPKKRRINTDPFNYNEDLARLPFEILAGTGGAATSEIFGAQYLSTGATILATPSDEDELVNNVGGAVYVYQYTTDSFLSNGIPYAVKTSPDQNIQLLTRRQDMGDGTTQLTAMVIGPNGFYDDEAWVPGTSYYDGLYVALSWDSTVFGNNTVNDDNWADHVSLLADKSYYIDLNGNTLLNVSPVLTKVR